MQLHALCSQLVYAASCSCMRCAANWYADFGFTGTKTAAVAASRRHQLHSKHSLQTALTTNPAFGAVPSATHESNLPRHGSSDQFLGCHCQWSGLSPGRGHVRHTEKNVALVHISVQVFRFSVLRTIPSQLHIHADAK